MIKDLEIIIGLTSLKIGDYIYSKYTLHPSLKFRELLECNDEGSCLYEKRNSISMIAARFSHIFDEPSDSGNPVASLID